MGDVLIGDNSLSKIVLDKGFAKPYFGDKKDNVCLFSPLDYSAVRLDV